MKSVIRFILWTVVMSFTAQSSTQAENQPRAGKRVPAEWEQQEATWLQWPGPWDKAFEPALATISMVITRYQRLHIISASELIENEARAAISEIGGNPDHENIRWHLIANDNAWLRDNGPVYVVDEGQMRVQNWAFDAWGGAFGPKVGYRHDDQVPERIGAYLDLPVDRIDIVHERGNLEFNGVDTVLLNWSVIGDPRRNPGYAKTQAEADLMRHFGVSRVVWIEGVPEGDLTNGHIDGIARFISHDTVVVAECALTSCRANGDAAIYDRAAETIASAGFTVVREPIEGTISYRGADIDTNYMNWLVGNGFVIAASFDNPKSDDAARARLERYFPGRQVHLVDIRNSWSSGGGVHCHTNDQPALLVLPEISPGS